MKANIVLHDLDTANGISERVLHVTVLNGNAFIEIFDYEEKYAESHFTNGKSIVVDGGALINAIISARNLDACQAEGLKAF